MEDTRKRVMVELEKRIGFDEAPRAVSLAWRQARAARNPEQFVQVDTSGYDRGTLLLIYAAVSLHPSYAARAA